MNRIRFIKEMSVNVVETKIIDGNIEVLTYPVNVGPEKTIMVTSLMPTNNQSVIDIIIEEENIIKVFKDIQITNLVILKGDISHLTNSPNSPKPPCGACPQR